MPPDTVAKIGNIPISATALRSFVENLDPGIRKQASQNPEIMARLVRQELTRLALLNEAKAKKWDARPDIAARADRAREDSIVASYLAANAAVPADYPSQSEIQAAYDANSAKLMMPRQYRLEQIFVANPAGGDTRAEASAHSKAVALAAKARAKGADFSQIAQTDSDKAAGEPAGNVGWASENQIVPEIREQVTGMAPGDISDPIKSGAGWHIIRMAETRPAGPKPLADVREQLVAALRQAKLQANEQSFYEAIQTKTPAMINQPLLQKIFDTAR